MKKLLVLSLVVLGGCTTHLIADERFRDYLNFQQECRDERNLKVEYCDQLWRSYMDAKAKIPAPVHNTNTTVINDNSVSGYVSPETALHIQIDQQQNQLMNDTFRAASKRLSNSEAWLQKDHDDSVKFMAQP